MKNFEAHTASNLIKLFQQKEAMVKIFADDQKMFRHYVAEKNMILEVAKNLFEFDTYDQTYILSELVKISGDY